MRFHLSSSEWVFMVIASCASAQSKEPSDWELVFRSDSSAFATFLWGEFVIWQDIQPPSQLFSLDGDAWTPEERYEFTLTPGFGAITGEHLIVNAQRRLIDQQGVVHRIETPPPWGVQDIATDGSSLVTASFEGQIHHSTDKGFNWITALSPAVGNLAGVEYGNGFWLTIENVSPPKALRSNDGHRWTAIGDLGGFGRIEQFRFGNGHFVAIFDDRWPEQILWSKDGVVWEHASLPTQEVRWSFYALEFGGGVFVIVGNNGTIWTSTDGTSWRARETGTSARLDSLAYGNGIWVAASRSAGILLRSQPIDGVEVHPVDLQIDTAIELRWYAENGTEYQVQSSPDMESWTDSGSRIPGVDAEVKIFRSRSFHEKFFRVISLRD